MNESGRLIPYTIKIANIHHMGGFLVMMNVEKAFDSLEFLISVLFSISVSISVVNKNNFEKSRIMCH